MSTDSTSPSLPPAVPHSAVRSSPATPNAAVVVADRARALMIVLLVCCAMTVAVTRLFLVLTGFPQVGGSTYHIAHALWGGLFLLAAAVVAVVVENRDGHYVVAALAGIGFGLFVDEVGKFITQKNDYFFPLAAPIVYASLLLILAVTEFAGRRQLSSPRAHLFAAIALSQTLADGTVTSTELARMQQHLRRAREGELDEASACLLDGIEHAVGLADRVDDTQTLQSRTKRRLHAWADRWLPEDRARKLARLAMAVFCASGVAQLLVLILLAATPGLLGAKLVREVHDVEVGRFGLVVQVFSLALGAAVAVLTAISFWSLRPGAVRRSRALRTGFAGMLLLLVLGNLLSSYVDQFTVLIEASLQVAAMGLLARWGRISRADPGIQADPRIQADRAS